MYDFDFDIPFYRNIIKVAQFFSDDGDDDDENGMPEIHDCRHEIRELHCRCLATVILKKFTCYDEKKPNFGKYGKTFVDKFYSYHTIKIPPLTF